MNKKWIFSLLLAGLCIPALAQLMLNPIRVVFDKNTRSSQLDLINTGNQSATYRLSLVNRRMSETGAFTPAELAEPGEQFADQLVRLSPRQVTMAPGATQVVRLSLRKPADLPEGEYRSHLLIERVADTTVQNSIEARANTDEPGISIQLIALVGASIPVIVRHGDTTYSMSLSDLALQPASATQAASLTLTLKRVGTRSSYGDLIVTFTPEGGTPREVTRAGGMAVYVPNPQRKITLDLPAEAGNTLARGKLHVEYRLRPEEGGKLMAEASMNLP
jgi:fimbrial chaperone protein